LLDLGAVLARVMGWGSWMEGRAGNGAAQGAPRA